MAMARERPVRGEMVRERMAQLRTLIEEKQAAFRRAASNGRLSVVTLKPGDSDREPGMTPALSDNFLHVEIAGVFPANQMLWTAVSHLTNCEFGGTPVWHAVPI